MMLLARDDQDFFYCGINTDNIQLLYIMDFRAEDAGPWWGVCADCEMLTWDDKKAAIRPKLPPEACYTVKTVRFVICRGEDRLAYFDTEDEAEKFLISLINKINGGK